MSRFHTIVVAVPDGMDDETTERQIEWRLRDDGAGGAIRVVEYHRERMTGEPCRECGAWPEDCPGGRGHDFQKENQQC